MVRWLLFAWPFAELWLLIRAGSAFGAFYTLAWVLGTALLGMFFLRRQALAMLLQPQALQPGDDAAWLLLDGPLRAMAGLLLILPGFITDAIGLLLLLPFVRRRVLRRWLGKMTLAGGVFPGGAFMAGASMPGSGRKEAPTEGAPVIEGEYVVVRQEGRQADHQESAPDRLPPGP